MLRRLRWLVPMLLIALVVPFLVVRILRTPSNDRAWVTPQRVLPRVTVRGDVVEIRNVREFGWRTESDFDVRYATHTYDLRKLDSVWYTISRFGNIPGLGHSFLTFGFGDQYVSISVEARREIGEDYSGIRGLLRKYELTYVIGAENDITGLRTNVWKEGISLYPVRTTPEKMRRAFVAMTGRAEQLAVTPEFYNTLTNSCISNVRRHVNDISPGKIGFGIASILPGFSDRLAYEQGLIDSTLPFEQIETAYRIESVAQRHGLGPGYSQAIRAQLPPR